MGENEKKTHTEGGRGRSLTARVGQEVENGVDEFAVVDGLVGLFGGLFDLLIVELELLASGHLLFALLALHFHEPFAVALLGDLAVALVTGAFQFALFLVAHAQRLQTVPVVVLPSCKHTSRPLSMLKTRQKLARAYSIKQDHI